MKDYIPSSQVLIPATAPESIGNAAGCSIWIVEEHNANRLAPLGCIGELVVEGPILARGWIFHTWLVITRECPPDVFTKTGDIVRYGPDGSIHFVRRKDGQLELRHRLETSESEHHIKSYLGDKFYVAVMKHRAPDLVENETSSGDFLAALICDLDGERNPGIPQPCAILDDKRAISPAVAEHWTPEEIPKHQYGT
ncbi:hypothetical protein N8T08_004683 [Aspergillus melleus]|uniref:Uncharacterized protein n=1 Tax=Aspergillus melleus TaxID=138277 RepID=A0ACC3B433_9EURO|nr:hypothetical protein N8T08_004683 [Aspergillus melleus]